MTNDFDLAVHLTKMSRGVASTRREGERAKVVRASCVFDASPEVVFRALTDPERLSRWFLPVSGDLRVGGTYQLEGNAGGSITTCDAPTELSVTWVSGGHVIVEHAARATQLG